MARQQTTNYSADIDTLFQWATTDGDFFDRELDLSFQARALERHDHSAGRGVAVGRVATGSIVSASFAAGAVNTAAIGALQVTTSKIAANAIDNTKLAVGAALANLGYTPVNKAGDSMTGILSMAAGIAVKFGGSPSPGQMVDFQGAGTVIYAHNNHLYLVNQSNTLTLLELNETGTIARLFGAWNIWHQNNDGAGSGLDADFLDGQQGSYYAPQSSLDTTNTNLSGLSTTVAGHTTQLNGLVGVPLAGIIIFRTAGELTAAGASWTTEGALAGRLPVGAGTTFGQTFSANNNYGLNWTPVSGLTVSGLGGPSETFPVANGTTQVASAGHTHGSPSVSGQGSVWHPPMYGVVFGRRI